MSDYRQRLGRNAQPVFRRLAAGAVFGLVPSPPAAGPCFPKLSRPCRLRPDPGAEPHVFLFFRAVTELGDSKWTLVPTGILGLLLVLAGRYGFSGHRPAAVSNWLASASFFVFCSVALSGIVVNVIKVVVGRARPKLIDQNGLTGFEPFTFDGALHSFLDTPIRSSPWRLRSRCWSRSGAAVCWPWRASSASAGSR